MVIDKRRVRTWLQSKDPDEVLGLCHPWSDAGDAVICTYLRDQGAPDPVVIIGGWKPGCFYMLNRRLPGSDKSIFRLPEWFQSWDARCDALAREYRVTAQVAWDAWCMEMDRNAVQSPKQQEVIVNTEEGGAGLNIYLAGKMDETHGRWRDHIVGEGNWILKVRPGDDWDYDSQPSDLIAEWPVRRGSVFGCHCYVGPYRQTIHHPHWREEHIGSFHGVDTAGMHGMLDDERSRSVIAWRANQAIKSADLVFAYLNAPDAYGTLLEIGYALALGKHVAVARNHSAGFRRQEDADLDYWFMDEWVQSTRAFRCKEKNEGQFLIDALKSAIVARAAKPKEQAQADPTARALAASVRSFEQIARWTSDPRVRDEAQRMLRVLSSVKG